MEANGAIAAIGDAPASASVHRVSHQQLSLSLGMQSRSTFTKRCMKFSAPDRCPRCGLQSVRILWNSIATRTPGGLQCESPRCRHRFAPRWTEERRLKHGELIKEIGRKHPHWSRPRKRHAALRTVKHRRKYLGSIFVRNGGFGAANSYALPEAARPAILKGGRPDDPTYDAAALARQFGDDLFDRHAHTWLKYASLNGFRKSYGWIWHPNLPDARRCSCRLGQRKLEFVGICPKCNGAGFIITSRALGGKSMPANGRIILHWLLDRGIDEEVRDKENKITKHRGILEHYTQADIGRALGLDVSTVRRYFRAFRWLNLVRTVPGKVTWNTDGSVADREAHKILWLPSRTMDEDVARAEKDRLDALVKWNRRFLEQRQLEALESAVALATQVLGEWEGQEHRLESFWNEMRRRLAARDDHARLVNVLFPLQRE
jgi:hypothetical protein